MCSLITFNFGIFIFWEIIFNHQHCLFIYFLTRWPFQTPDGEVEASIFLLVGSCPAKAREFGHTSRLHGSRYKPTDLNHYVGHDLISHELQRFDYKLWRGQSMPANENMDDSRSLCLVSSAKNDHKCFACHTSAQSIHPRSVRTIYGTAFTEP